MHIPVLLHESIEGLAAREGDVVLDATVGDGGHARALCERIGASGRLIGIDLDEDALTEARRALANSLCRHDLFQANFRELDGVLRRAHVKGVQRVLLDLGMRSDQLERSGRGFSFLRDEPLLMTFEKISPDSTMRTAAAIVNTWPEEDLAKIFREYGEERHADRIAAAIVRARKHERIIGTRALRDIVTGAVPPRGRAGQRDPATKTFQALRIAVNDELEALREALRKSAEALLPGGRIAVISFHSLEDRIVKLFFKQLADEESFTVITKKPVTPSRAESERNPRARSAKLRIAERISR